MANKKLKRKKKAAPKKKTAPKKKAAPKKKTTPPKRAVAKKKATSLKKTPVRQKASRPEKRPRGRSSGAGEMEIGRSGFGPDSGGQSGDVQGLSRAASADSESVEELVEEGQAFEAEAISGVENALDPDESEVTTKQVPEDDVPLEDQDEQ
jgi:hypothetical protein